MTGLCLGEQILSEDSVRKAADEIRRARPSQAPAPFAGDSVDQRQVTPPENPRCVPLMVSGGLTPGPR